MKTPYRNTAFRLTALASAIALASASAWAADGDEVADLVKPESSIRLGIGHLSDRNRRFGQYNGLSEGRAYGLFDIDYARREDASGTWYRLYGRNLGLESRELRADVERQGVWGAFVDYSRILRLEPLQVTTGLTGIGTATQAIGGTAPREIDLQTRRDRYSLGFDKALGQGLELQLRFKQEDKDGARIFGRGTGQFLAEPIAGQTQQLEAIINYAGKQLQLSGGYYGSFYKNRNSVLIATPGTAISLAPDNESHQLFLAGGYNLTPATRATFKVAKARGTQNESFFTSPDLAGNVQTSLNGRLDTTSAQLGLTTRPIPRLSLSANLRYEDREDKTPRYQFLTPSTGRDGFNTPFSRTTVNSKLEANYQLPMGFRLIGGVELEQRKRSVLSIRQASWREQNDEQSYRVELRRSLSETLNGSISLIHADRGGSDYLPANNNAAADFIDPIHFADRKRDKTRFSMDWIPLEQLSVQLRIDDSRDRYAGRPLGPDTGTARLYALDGTYTVSDNWQVSAWFTRDDTRVKQSTLTGANGTTVLAQEWQSNLRMQGDSAGLSVRGKPSGQLEIGADLQFGRDTNHYGLVANLPAAAALPSIVTRRTVIRLFGQYAVQRNFGLRLDLISDRARTNDWTWSDWQYADGTRVFQDPNTRVTFIGVTAIYRMR